MFRKHDYFFTLEMSAPMSEFQPATPSTPVERLVAGDGYVVVLGGQGVDYRRRLEQLVDRGEAERVGAEWDQAQRVLQPVAHELAMVGGAGPLLSLVSQPELAARDINDGAGEASLSVPAIVATQLAAWDATCHQWAPGHHPDLVVGHSQGILAALGLLAPEHRVELLAIAMVLGGAVAHVGSAAGLVSADGRGLLGVAGCEREALDAWLDTFNPATPLAADRVELALVNGRRRFALSGRADQVRRFRGHVEAELGAGAERWSNPHTDARGVRWDYVDVPVAFHHTALEPVVELTRSWTERCGLSLGLHPNFHCVSTSNGELLGERGPHAGGATPILDTVVRSAMVEMVDWPAQLDRIADRGSPLVVDLGPGSSMKVLGREHLDGTGATWLSLTTDEEDAAAIRPGASPAPLGDWSAFVPRLATDSEGQPRLVNRLTEALRCSPVVLAGMTPSTVEAPVVAAAANAGFWSELAGGGQVTAEICWTRFGELQELLAPGAGFHFNALYLDPYLWSLQMGPGGVVRQAIRRGVPISGVTISAGTPPLDEAVRLIEELSADGVEIVTFKPGTVEGIAAVVDIAAALADHTIGIHVEGGLAGGHHSWEDLDALLLDTYADIRRHPNLLLCVGGGIATPADAAKYLLGTWAHRYGRPAMAADGVLIGTAAMATAEACTSQAVKELLVDAPGHRGWVANGDAYGGITSGRSQLDADLHQIDNAASRCGRLLDEIAGDAEAVVERRAEILGALNATAKPYFGDVDAMTYREMLDRFITLCAVGDHGRYDDGVWLDITWRERFEHLVHQTEARLSVHQHGEFRSVVGAVDPAAEPNTMVAALAAEYRLDTRMHPGDVVDFLATCDRPGKPVPFVAVIDADVRRRWSSDSLWYSHHDCYRADEVVIIPGPASLAGIDRLNEPVAELLARFERGATNALMAEGGDDVLKELGVSGEANAAGGDPFGAPPRIGWAATLVANPLHSVAKTVGGSHSSGPPERIEVALGDDDAPRLGMRRDSAGHVFVDDADTRLLHEQLVKLAAGGDVPEEPRGWSDADARLHADYLGSDAVLADALMSHAWPALFDAVRKVDVSGTRGFLDLVHLDHVAIVTRWPDNGSAVTPLLDAVQLEETSAGLVLAVEVELRCGGAPVARLAERFLIRRDGPGDAVRPVDSFGHASAVVPCERTHLRTVVTAAPLSSARFAALTGDHNPLHTSPAVASLAGFDGTIVHGMWVSALMQSAALADRSRADGTPITAWQVSFVAPTRPGDEVSVRVDRVGRCDGGDLLEITASVHGEDGPQVVARAEAVVAGELTCLAFPGQGIQRRGMGLDLRERSRAAADIWERAEHVTTERLGFSIHHIVANNPAELRVGGETLRHPKGVLNLTQFTQVAMAVVASAQVAELRERGLVGSNTVFCGHSIGEYNALAALGGVIPLEALVEVVYLRGCSMASLVERDESGRTNYAMCAARPEEAGMSEADLEQLVAEIARDDFCQVVNYNQRGRQYAIAGTLAALKRVEAELKVRRKEAGGRAVFVPVPGIDVPFHSAALHDGVASFRDHLDAVLPETIDVHSLIGRFIPNLVPRLFSLDRSFVAEIAHCVDSAPLDAVLADWATASANSEALGRTVLIELLAWQFASPVQWIATMDLLFGNRLGGHPLVERFVEVGIATQPTLTNLAKATVAHHSFVGTAPQILHLELDQREVFGEMDADPAAVGESVTSEPVEDGGPGTVVDVQVPAGDAGGADAVDEASDAAGAVEPGPAEAAPLITGGAPLAAPPADQPYTAGDAARLLVAWWTKVRPDQLTDNDSVERLVDGVSSRRNQILMDLGAEFDLGAIDGAAEATLGALATEISGRAARYKPFGRVLEAAVDDQLKDVCGPAGGRRSGIGQRLERHWGLGGGWVAHVSALMAVGTLPGSSVRGGDLSFLEPTRPTTATELDQLIDNAVVALGASLGVTVAPVAVDAPAVDGAAVSAALDSLTGPGGVLHELHAVLGKHLGSAAGPETESPTTSPWDDVARHELSREWLEAVTPVFAAEQAQCFDDRWATSREDLARLASLLVADSQAAGGIHSDIGEKANEADEIEQRLLGRLDTASRAQAHWWSGHLAKRGHTAGADRLAALAGSTPQVSPRAHQRVLVTGASPNSIAAALVEYLLAEGATVVVTTSSPTPERARFYRDLYARCGSVDAALHVVPCNAASFGDIDALGEWLAANDLVPNALVPFAAPRVAGELTEVGPRFEAEMRVLLWGVERLISTCAAIDHSGGNAMQVLLPGSPNRGRFGGDGAYGEAKAAFDALTSRAGSETGWGTSVTITHAIIGWVRGTGLMGGNDGAAAAAEAAGVTTYSTHEMASLLLDELTPDAEPRSSATSRTVDLSGGLGETVVDLRAVVASESVDADPTDRSDRADSGGRSDRLEQIDPVGEGEGRAAVEPVMLRALPRVDETPHIDAADWDDLDLAPEDLVVIVSTGELGPFGSGRVRQSFEVSDDLTPAGVAELAWMCGLISWDNSPRPGFYDATSGDLVDEADLFDRYHDEVRRRCGIRHLRDDLTMEDGTIPVLTSVFLDADVTFTVSSLDEAQAFVSSDPAHTSWHLDAATGEYRVTRAKGTEVRVPRRLDLVRDVGAQLPDDFDPSVYGIPAEMIDRTDRVAIWNLFATVDAFTAAGLEPAELLRWVHPLDVANTQGTGMGGLSSIRDLNVGLLLGSKRPNDVLQEALPNVVAAHVMQSYLGGYGSTVQPVAACATAAISVEEAYDKIRLGKASVVIAGGYDDYNAESLAGFADMSATADTAKLADAGVEPRHMSRPNDRRRGGFVEAQGGGTVLVVRGDIALELGLPVRAVVGWAGSFSDGTHTSIPAPGLGLVGAARGGGNSPVATALDRHGLGADDIAVVSKHDTSTAANDPNESLVHEAIADAIGRDQANPLLVVSQKSLTGHAKGGAAAFQIGGLCDIFATGIVPPNRSLDCVDPELRNHERLVWLRTALERPADDPIRAGLVTSLGFGHVSALVLLVHPGAFLSAVPADRRADYQQRATERAQAGHRRRLWAARGGAPLFQKPPHRRVDDTAHEVAVLTDPTARLASDGRFRVGEAVPEHTGSAASTEGLSR
jgi:fatty acid synthase